MDEEGLSIVVFDVSFAIEFPSDDDTSIIILPLKLISMEILDIHGMLIFDN